MAKEIAFENGWISNFEGLVTLTLDQAGLCTDLDQTEVKFGLELVS